MSEVEYSNWKLVLLYWINRSECLDKQCYSIENADVCSFFEKFRKRLTAAEICENNLVEFIETNYPDFDLQSEQRTYYNTNDYIYIYSLLLHFSCVRHLDDFFQKVCQQLSEQFQQAITLFLKSLTEKKTINKNDVLDAIALASANGIIPFARMDSPVRTPKFKYTPPTPKSNLFEELTKEVNHLKTTLDNELYERGKVEIQVEALENKVEKLNQEKKKLEEEINDLRNEILMKSTEDTSPTKNIKDEQIKKRLRGKIAEKEELVTKLKLDLNILQEEKLVLEKKCAHAEKEIRSYQAKVNNYESMNINLKATLDERETRIKELSEECVSLELFIKETRSGKDFKYDSSVECLDISSANDSSTENLGRAVVDIQLREKEDENLILREEIERTKLDGQKLSSHISDLIVRFSKAFNADDDTLELVENSDPNTNIVRLDDFLQKLVIEHKKINEFLIVLKDQCSKNQEEIEKKNIENANLYTEVNRFKNDISTVKEEQKILEDTNINLTSQISEISSSLSIKNKKIEQLEKDAGILNKKINDFQQQLCHSEEEISLLKYKEKELNENIRKFEEECVVNKKDIEGKTNENAELSSKIIQLSNDIEKSECQRKELEEINSKLNSDMVILTSTLESKENKIKDLESSVLVLNERLTEINNELSSSSKTVLILQENETELQKEIFNYKQKCDKNMEEIRQISKKNSELSAKIEKLQSDFQEVEKEKNEIHKINCELNSEIVSLKLANESKDNKINELDNNIKCTTEKMDNLEMESTKISLKISNLESREIELQKEIINYQEEISQNKKQIESKTTENADLCVKIDQLLNEIAHIKNEQNNLLEINSSLKCELSSVTANLDVKNELIFKLEENIKQLNIKAMEYQVKLDEYLKSIGEFQKKESTFQNEINSYQKQYHQNKQEIECKITENRNLSSEIDKLRNNINNLEHQNEEFERIVSNLNGEITTLTSKVNDKEFQIQELENNTIYLNEKIKNFEDDMSINAKNISELLNKEMKLQKQISDYEKQNSKNKEEIDSKIVENSELSTRLTTLMCKVENYDKNIKELQKTNCNLTEQITNLTTTLEHKECRINELEENVKTIQQMLTEAENNLENSSEKITELQLKENSLEKEILEYKHKLTNNEEENSKLFSKIVELHDNIQISSTEMQKLMEDKNLDIAITLLNSNLEERKSRIFELEESAECLKSKIVQYEQLINVLKLENTEFTNNKPLIEQQINDLQAKFNQKNNEFMVITEERDKLNAVIESIQKECYQLKEDQRNYECAKLDRDKIINDQEMRISLIQAEKIDLMNKIEDLQKRSESSEAFVEELQKEINELRDKSSETKANYEKEIDDLKNKKNILETFKITSEKASDALGEKLTVIEQKIRRLIEESEQVRFTYESRLRENDSKHSELHYGLTENEIVLRETVEKIGAIEFQCDGLGVEKSILRDRFCQLSDSCKLLETLVNRLKITINNLEKKSRKNITDLEERLTSMQDELDMVRKSKETTENEKVSLLSQLNKIEGEYQKNLEETKVSCSKYEENIQEIETRNAILQQEVSQTKDEIDERNTKISCLEKEISQLYELKSAFDNVTSKHEEIEKLVLEKNSLIDKLNNVVDLLKKEKIEIEAGNAELESKVANLCDVNDQLEHQIKNMGNRIVTLESSNKELIDEVKELADIAKKSDNSLHNLEDSLQKVMFDRTNKYGNEIKAMRQSVKFEKIEKEKFKDELNKSVAQIRNLEVEVENLIKLRSELENVNESNLIELVALRSGNELSKSAHNESLMALETMQKLVDHMSAELLQYKDSIEGIKRENNNLQELYKIASVEKETFKSRIEIVENELCKAHQNFASKEDDVNKLQELNKDIAAKLSAAETKLNTIQSELQSAVQDDLNLTKDQILEQKRINSELNKEIIDLEIKIKTLNVENQKLLVSNTKMGESISLLTKNVEIKSFKLGEAQAQIRTLEKSITDMKNGVEIHERKNNSIRSSLESLQFDYEKVQQEFNIVNEKLNETNQQIAVLMAKNKTLEDVGNKLRTEIEVNNSQKVELKEAIDNYTKRCNRLEDDNKILVEFVKQFLSVNEEILSKMGNTVTVYDEPIRLNEKGQDTISIEKLKEKCEEVSKTLCNLHKENINLKEFNKKLETEYNLATTLKCQRKVTTEYDCHQEIDHLKSEIVNLKAQLGGGGILMNGAIIKTNGGECFDNIKTEFNDNLSETFIMQKSHSPKRMEQQICTECTELRRKVDAIQEKYNVEKELNEKLKTDTGILQAKLYKHRSLSEDKEKRWLEEHQQLLTQVAASEDRLKTNRIELEGKLEKMKAKMKMLYNEEVEKIKKKCAHEYESKNEQYEAHTQKLAIQIYQLNETILELQKENKFLEAKLKDTKTISTVMSCNQLVNFPSTMEDEEEGFLNTYLSDLKNGRVTPFGRESICAQELQHRNSLAPRHLRSTYTAQYGDQHLREEDIKDNMAGVFDDSLASLLQTGQRKKISGTTSYQKPGPPTPSKNSGRLSLGGANAADLIAKDILKDANEAPCLKSDKGSPVKSKNMISLARKRDENTPPKRRFSNLFRKGK